MRRTSTHLLALSLAAALLTGCQTSSSDPFGHDRDGKDQTVKLEDRPPMETMLTSYRAFQADLFAQLGKTFGYSSGRRILTSSSIAQAAPTTSYPTAKRSRPATSSSKAPTRSGAGTHYANSL